MPGRQRKRPSSTPSRVSGSPAFDAVRRIAHELPEVEDSTSYGTPALKVHGVLMARLWEDGETLVLKSTFIDRDLLVRAEPETYYFTDHYRNYEWILVHLSRIRPTELRERLEEAWRRVAPKGLLAAFDAPTTRKLPRQ
jgi:hypothetical protein